MLCTSAFNMARGVTVKKENTGISRTNKDTTFMVLTDVTYHTYLLFRLEITFHRLAVIA